MLASALVGFFLLASSARADAELDAEQALLFQQTCAVCHVKPGLGVPLVGNDDDWKKRRAQGFDVLLGRTIDGYGNMPPLGTCASCTEQDLRQLVGFVAGIEVPARPARTRDD